MLALPRPVLQRKQAPPFIWGKQGGLVPVQVLLWELGHSRITLIRIGQRVHALDVFGPACLIPLILIILGIPQLRYPLVGLDSKAHHLG